MQLTFKCFRKHTLTYTKVLTLVSSLYYSCYFLVSLKLFQRGFFLSLYKDIDSKYYFPTSHILLLYFTVLSSVDPLATNTPKTLKAEHFIIAVHANLLFADESGSQNND